MSQWESLPPATQALLNAHGGQRGTYVHASVVRALKGHAGAALFLSQLLYWSARATLEDGWFYNTREEYEAQIGMGKGAQRTAQNLLVGLGLLRVERRGVPPKNHYRVDLQAVHDLLASTAMQDQETLSTTQNHQTSTILDIQTSRMVDNQTSRMVDNQTSRTTRPSYKEITEETTEKTTKREAAREKTQEITTQHTHEANTPENENTEHQHSETLTHHILNGKPNPRYEQARVRNTLKRLAGNRFTSRHEFDLLSWARHTNEQLQNLYNASDPQHWPGETNKPRKFILEDLLNGDRKPPTKTSLELERETEPYTLHELIDMHKNGDADLALKLMDNYGKNTTA